MIIAGTALVSTIPLNRKLTLSIWFSWLLSFFRATKPYAFYFVGLFLFCSPIPNPLFRLEEEWEKELEAELQDYEVVGEQKTNSNKGDNWEQEMEEMLEDDADLK